MISEAALDRLYNGVLSRLHSLDKESLPSSVSAQDRDDLFFGIGFPFRIDFSLWSISAKSLHRNWQDAEERSISRISYWM